MSTKELVQQVTTRIIEETFIWDPALKAYRRREDQPVFIVIRKDNAGLVERLKALMNATGPG